MDLASKADDPYVPNDRWIASLSDGRTVFQNDIPNQKSAWRRLQDVLIKHNLRITRLRLQARGQLVTMPLPEDVDGYWQASRIRRIVSPGVAAETLDRGIGYIKDNQVHIKWIYEDGTLSEETRPYDPDRDLAGILND